MQNASSYLKHRAKLYQQARVLSDNNIFFDYTNFLMF